MAQQLKHVLQIGDKKKNILCITPGRGFVECAAVTKYKKNGKIFRTFVNDIKSRPSDKHQLRKLDETKGYTKENLIWKEVIPSQDSAKYQREWRKQNPDKVKTYDLKSKFGISLFEYNDLRHTQNYSCKICGTKETDLDENLVVDHCHTTGKIRGLLCHCCNRGLGLLKDDTEILQKAIDYLSA